MFETKKFRVFSTPFVCRSGISLEPNFVPGGKDLFCLCACPLRAESLISGQSPHLNPMVQGSTPATAAVVDTHLIFWNSDYAG